MTVSRNTQRAKVKVPKCWRDLIQTEFPDDLSGILSEKTDHTGDGDPKPHYDDTRKISGEFRNGIDFSIMLCSGQHNYWGGFTVGEYDSDILETFPDVLETKLDGVQYEIEVDWI